MNRMLILYIFLLLCGTVSAQQTVEWNDLQPLTDDAHRTVYYKKDSKRPLQGKYRIIRGLDEEHVKLSDGMINGDYHRYRDGVLRESGIYVKGKRNGTFTEYYQDGVTPRKETPILQGKIDGTVKTIRSKNDNGAIISSTTCSGWEKWHRGITRASQDAPTGSPC